MVMTESQMSLRKVLDRSVRSGSWIGRARLGAGDCCNSPEDKWQVPKATAMVRRE